MKPIVVPNKILMPEVVRGIESGSEVKLRANGRSMRPNIRDGPDILVLGPVDVNMLRRWDIVLAETPKDHYVVHRIVSMDGDKITLKGDGNFRGKEHCLRGDIRGQLVAIERNGRRIDCTTTSRVLIHLLRRNVLRLLQTGRLILSRILFRTK